MFMQCNAQHNYELSIMNYALLTLCTIFALY